MTLVPASCPKQHSHKHSQEIFDQTDFLKCILVSVYFHCSRQPIQFSQII